MRLPKGNGRQTYLAMAEIYHLSIYARHDSFIACGD